MANGNGLLTNDFSGCKPNPNQLRWDAFPVPGKPTDFVQGLFTQAGAGSPALKEGIAIHQYLANKNMTDHNRCMYNSDGDFLFGEHNLDGWAHLARMEWPIE